MPTPTQENEPKSALSAKVWLLLPAAGPALIWLLTAAFLPGAALLLALPIAGVLLVFLPFLARYALRRVNVPLPRLVPVFVVSICSVVTNVVLAGVLAEPVLELTAAKSDWNTKPLDTWAGPNQKATWRTRTVASALTYFSAAGIRSEEEWVAQGRGTTSSRKVVSSIGKYLSRTRILEQFAGTNFFIDGVEQRAPDFRFVVVSILPTVVVMVSHAYKHGGALIETRGYANPGSEDPSWGYRLSNSFIVDDIFVKTSFPSSEEMLWFDANGPDKPAPIFRAGASQAQICVAGAVLDFKLTEGRVISARR